MKVETLAVGGFNILPCACYRLLSLMGGGWWGWWWWWGGQRLSTRFIDLSLFYVFLFVSLLFSLLGAVYSGNELTQQSGADADREKQCVNVILCVSYSPFGYHAEHTLIYARLPFFSVFVSVLVVPVC